MSEPSHLTPEQVTRLLEIVQDTDAIVVGGQSLNLWAAHYQGRHPQLEKYQPFTSKDIDFFKSEKAAERLAKELNGYIQIPDIDCITPNAAV